MSQTESVLFKTFRKKSHPQNTLQGQGWEETEVNDTLNIYDNGEVRTPTLIVENHPNDSRMKFREDGVFQTLSSRMGTGGNNCPMVMENRMESVGNAPLLIENHPQDGRTRMVGDGTVNQPLSANMGHDPINGGFVMDSVVRRLTPMECERLQGYPDGWTDIGDWTDSKGKLHKSADSSRYKALGNSIALPFWAELAKAVVKRYDHPVTMGSLFDGIGGFVLCFERAGATAIWASEVEPFCIAVTERRFPDGSLEKRNNSGI